MIGELCRVDIQVDNLNFDALSKAEIQRVGPDIAETIAIENGLSMSDVMSLKQIPGDVSFVRGPQSGSDGTIDFSTSIVAMLDQCEASIMTKAIFRNPRVQTALLRSLKHTLGDLSKAIVGKLVIERCNVTLGALAPKHPRDASGIHVDLQRPLANVQSDGITLPMVPNAGKLVDRGAVVEEVQSHHHLFFGIGIWFVLTIVVCYCLWHAGRSCCSSRGKRQQLEVAEEGEDDFLFTGH